MQEEVVMFPLPLTLLLGVLLAGLGISSGNWAERILGFTFLIIALIQAYVVYAA